MYGITELFAEKSREKSKIMLRPSAWERSWDTQ
jgi:hypothetical protein